MIRNKLYLISAFSFLFVTICAHTMGSPPVRPDTSIDSVVNASSVSHSVRPELVEGGMEQLKIMTFNIRRKGKEKDESRLWKKRLPLIISLLAKTKPDIIGFQEVTQEQIEDLLKSLPDNYKYFGIGRGQSWAGLGTDEATPIFFDSEKLIVQKQETFQINKTSWWNWAHRHDEYGFLPRICTYGLLALKKSGKKLHIFNTHLDHEFEKARINQLKKILEKAAIINDNPVFIMGDFNTDLVEPIKRELNKQKFINTKKITTYRSGPKETYTGWGDETEKLIDHILVKNNTNLTIKKHSVIKKEEYPSTSSGRTGFYPSDHRPVIVEVSL